MKKIFSIVLSVFLVLNVISVFAVESGSLADVIENSKTFDVTAITECSIFTGAEYSGEEQDFALRDLHRYPEKLEKAEVLLGELKQIAVTDGDIPSTVDTAQGWRVHFNGQGNNQLQIAADNGLLSLRIDGQSHFFILEDKKSFARLLERYLSDWREEYIKTDSKIESSDNTNRTDDAEREKAVYDRDKLGELYSEKEGPTEDAVKNTYAFTLKPDRSFARTWLGELANNGSVECILTVYRNQRVPAVLKVTSKGGSVSIVGEKATSLALSDWTEDAKTTYQFHYNIRWDGKNRQEYELTRYSNADMIVSLADDDKASALIYYENADGDMVRTSVLKESVNASDTSAENIDKSKDNNSEVKNNSGKTETEHNEPPVPSVSDEEVFRLRTSGLVVGTRTPDGEHNYHITSPLKGRHADIYTNQPYDLDFEVLTASTWTIQGNSETFVQYSSIGELEVTYVVGRTLANGMEYNHKLGSAEFLRIRGDKGTKWYMQHGGSAANLSGASTNLNHSQNRLLSLEFAPLISFDNFVMEYTTADYMNPIYVDINRNNKNSYKIDSISVSLDGYDYHTSISEMNYVGEFILNFLPAIVGDEWEEVYQSMGFEL